jgi:hypothetical protein
VVVEIGKGSNSVQQWLGITLEIVKRVGKGFRSNRAAG